MSLKNSDIDNSNELNNGVNMIISAFNEQRMQYLKIIDSLQEKISSLESIIKKLQKDNMAYQKKLRALQSNIKCISNTIFQPGDDEEEFINEKYLFNKRPKKENSHKKHSFNKINSSTRILNNTINNIKKESHHFNKNKSSNKIFDYNEDNDIKTSNKLRRKNSDNRDKISSYKKPKAHISNNLINNINYDEE